MFLSNYTITIDIYIYIYNVYVVHFVCNNLSLSTTATTTYIVSSPITLTTGWHH